MTTKGSVPFHALEPGLCKWGLTNPGPGQMMEMPCCGQPATRTREGWRPYCEAHTLAAVNPRWLEKKRGPVELTRSLRGLI